MFTFDTITLVCGALAFLVIAAIACSICFNVAHTKGWETARGINRLVEIDNSKKTATLEAQNRDLTQDLAKLSGQVDAANRGVSHLSKWKDVVLDMLITLHVYDKHDEDNPRAAVFKLIQQEIDIALCPQVSKAAAALVAQGVKQGMAKAAVKIAKLQASRADAWERVAKQ